MFKKRGINFAFVFALATILMMSLVVAQTDGGILGDLDNFPSSSSGSDATDSFKTSVGSFISDTTGSFFQEGGTFARWLIFILVLLVIYSITPFLPFLDNKPWISFGVSGVVAILSTFWLSQGEIQAALLSYGPLGITITAIIPLFAVAAIAKISFDKGHIFFSKLIWAFFFALVAFRLVIGWVDDSLTPFAGWAYIVALVIAAFMFFGEGMIYNLMTSLGGNAGVYARQQTQISQIKADIAIRTRQLASATRTTDINRIEADIKRMKNTLKRMKKL